MNAVRKSLPYIILTALLGAGMAAQGLFKQNNPPDPTLITNTPTQTSVPIIQTPSETPTYQGCAYIWASHELPDITKQLQEAIKALQPQATAIAQAFGEDCVSADGNTTFGAIETDFLLTFEADLTNEEELGKLIVQGMKAISQIPRDSLPGPQPGRATFTFTKGDQTINVIVDITKYNELPENTSAQDIYQTFSTK